MKPFRKAGGKTWQVRLYDAAGKPHDRSTESRDKGTANTIARAIERVREQLKYRAIYEAVIARELTVVEVWNADRTGALDGLLARLADVNVEPLVDDWRRRLTTGEGEEERKKKVAPSTAREYLRAVRLLIPEGAPFPSSRLSSDALQEWLDAMEDAEPNTVRNRGVGVHRFVAWLVKPRAVLARDPFLEVELPAPGKPRDHHIETDEAIELAEAQPEPYRTFSALIHGTGIEVSTSLRLTARDVFRETKEVRAAGTKTYNRDRIVRVAEWAWPYLERRLKGRIGGARLFEDIPDRWRARLAHEVARVELAKANAIFEGYTMRDARHTWAVRAVRSGWPIEAVSRQLGHKDGVLALKVYGRFQPQSAERDRWEAMATARDAARRAAR